MCTCNPKISKKTSLYDLDETDKANYAKKLPQLAGKRIQVALKHILYTYMQQIAEYIFTNGSIYTMDDNNPQVEAVAVRGGEIMFAGKMVDALAYRGQSTQIVDLKGRTMLPGFIDPHVHMSFTMLSHWLDLSPFVHQTKQEIRELVVQKVKQTEFSQWVLGQLYDPLKLQGQFDISRAGLDAISENVPIFILQANGHVAHMNSAGFRIAGIAKQTPDPKHGRFIRDQNGQLTGQLQESAVMMVRPYLLVPGFDYSRNFRDFLHYSASKGCTSLHDCGIGFIDPKSDLAVLYQAMENDPPVRYSGFLVSTSWEQWVEQGIKPDYTDRSLRICGVKCWADGSLQAGSAYMREAYLKAEWKKGSPNYNMQALTKSIREAVSNGWQVGVHANGDAAIDMVLDAFEQVLAQFPSTDLRHRIEHCTVCHPDQLQRMKQLGITPSFLIGHVYYYGDTYKQLILGQQRANLVDPLHSAVQAGLRPSIHSDYNCQPMNPLRCIHNAVTRRVKATGQILNPGQRVSPLQAIKCMTIDAAWQCHLEDIVGSVEVGKRADFVVLAEDPMKVQPDKIIDIGVVETWMDGKITYKAQNLKNLQSCQSFNSQFSIKSDDSIEVTQPE